MGKVPREKLPRTRERLALVGLCLGGLAPLITGLIGLWDYVTRGYFISKTGQIVSGPSGIIVSCLFVLAGIAMIIVAVNSYRRNYDKDKN